MITVIGIVAGDIWHYLDEKGNVTLNKLIKDLNKPAEVVHMSVGWLAREGHVLLGPPDQGYPISLVKR
jgi:hypothetical protein